MKKLILTAGVLAATAGSQLAFGACTDSGIGDSSTPATCDSAVTLQVSDLVVIKGLDDYDFTDPAANGWDGTAGTNALVTGDVCVGTNNSANGVDVTFDSANGFAVSDGSNPDVSYSMFFNGSAVALTDGQIVDVTAGTDLDDLACANENFALNVQFDGTALVTAAVGSTYSDTVTVTVAPN